MRKARNGIKNFISPPFTMTGEFGSGDLIHFLALWIDFTLMSLLKRPFLEYSKEISSASQSNNKRPRIEPDISKNEIFSTMPSEMFIEITSYITPFDRIVLALTNKTFLRFMNIFPVRIKFDSSRIGRIPHKEMEERKKDLKKHIWIHAADSGYLINEKANIFKWLLSTWPFLNVGPFQFHNSWNNSQLLILEAVAGKGSVNIMNLLLNSEGYSLKSIETRIIAKAARHANFPMFEYLATNYEFVKDCSILRSAIKSKNPEIAVLILKYKKNQIRRVFNIDDRSISDLFYEAARLGWVFMMEVLLRENTNILQRGGRGGFFKILSVIIESGNYEAVVWFINFIPSMVGVIDDICDPKDVFLAAIRSNNINILEFITEKYGRDFKRLPRAEVLKEALWYNNPTIMTWLIANEYIDAKISWKRSHK